MKILFWSLIILSIVIVFSIFVSIIASKICNKTREKIQSNHSQILMMKWTRWNAVLTICKNIQELFGPVIFLGWIWFLYCTILP